MINKNNEELIFILGAKDPEMDKIEKLLLKINSKYLYAEVEGKRCHPGNSYQADNNEKIKNKNLVFIECKINNVEPIKEIDHHKEGDYGYSLDYNNFLEASSIGQLIKYIINESKNENDIIELLKFESMPFASYTDNFSFNEKTEEWLLGSGQNDIIIPKEYVITAAIDHSLSESYLNLCKGVNNKDIEQQQILNISEVFDNNEELVKNTMFELSSYFENNQNKIDNILDFRYLNLGIGYSLNYLCFRDLRLKYNKEIVVNTQDYKDGPNRLMFINIDSEKVEKLLKNKEWDGITFDKVFGVPNRKYFGGFYDRKLYYKKFDYKS